MKKIRLDLLLTQKGLTPSREKAQALVLAGQVLVEGEPAVKPGQLVSSESDIAIREAFPYVSRAGAKLEQALKTFKIKVQNKIALDVGVSTGGFTDCLLQFGARKVYAVDVNIKQLDWKLRQDPRVVAIQKNARYLQSVDLPETPDIGVIDVSFISILKILPAVKAIMPFGEVLALIKPQFEAVRHQVGKKGIIRERRVHQEVLEDVLSQVQRLGFGFKGLLACTTLGQKGNQEFLAWFKPGLEGLSGDDLRKIIQEILPDENN
ncbi:MAG: TlyA family RNA methyltransferase [Acidobacteriota bacterium]|nr:TlyA family RNA methyltransferase [Acidobacteriota bacterium]MDW3228334.1 TlyA family RNA methyltransferase [Acidobacteriota bacterium]